MYSKQRSKVGDKSSIPLCQKGTQEVVYSEFGILNREHPGGEMCCGAVKGDIPSSKDCTYIGNEDASNARQMMYPGSVLGNSHAQEKIYHRVLQGEVQNSEDIGFREQDNSQDSNESGSYTEMSPAAKSESFENVAYLSQTAEVMRSQLSETNSNNTEALKEELLQIFEMYFKRKMEDRLQGLRSKQMESEETKRAHEKEELGSKMAKEKTEMQKHFADGISKLTHSFNEERKQLEKYYEEQLKDLGKKLGAEQNRVEGKFAAQGKLELKEMFEDDYQVLLMKKTLQEKQEAMREKSEIIARFNKEKFELEKNFNFLLTEAEAGLHRVRAELKESLCLQRESQQKIVDLDVKLKEEKEQRLGVERELEEEKAKCHNEEALDKKKNEQLKSEVGVLRQEIEEKNRQIKKLVEANQESNLKIRALTRHLQKWAKRNSEDGSVKSQESEGRAAVDDRTNTVQTDTRDLQGNPREIDTRAVGSKNTIVKVYDSKMRLTDERKRILVFVTLEKRSAQGLSRFISALLPKQPISSTVRILMASDNKDVVTFSA